MDVRSLAGKTVLVTGAASGIGQASARAFAERGANLALCDVDEENLGRLEKELVAAGCEVLVQRVDVARADQMAAFAEAVHARVPAVDILVNNAGVALGASFLETTLEDWNWILSINLRGVVHGCHAFVPRMVERGQGGHVANIASIAGHVAGEALCAYCTTKFAVVGLSEALREELAPHGIGVTAVCPGLINTPIIQNARIRGRDNRQAMIDVFEKRGYPPERVARNLLKAVQRNRAVAPISPEAWVLYYLKRAVPGLVRRISAAMNRQVR